MSPDKPRARLRPATDFPAEEVQWLWPGKIPIGKVTLLVGDPGCGKSLVALDAAARVTRGDTWPACQPPALPGVCLDEPTRSTQTRNGSDNKIAKSAASKTDPRQSWGLAGEHASGSVLILSAEDQIADTIRPRLDAAGADPAKVFFASEITDLRSDLGLLAEMLDDAPDCRLIIVDPVTAYVGPSDSHFHTIVRKVLAPLAELAAKRKIAILAVTHLRKNSGAAITRATGSMGFAAAARCVWTVMPDAEEPTRNLLLPVKNNLGPKEAGLAFTIEKTDGARAPTIHWHDAPVESPTSAAPTAKRGPEAEDRQNAARWLQLALADGPRECYEVMREGKSNGFHPRTLQRALHLVGGFTRKQEFLGGWLWSLNSTSANPDTCVAGIERAANQAKAPTPEISPSPQSPAPIKQPVAFDETCRLRENSDESPTENLSPSSEPPTASVAESIRFLNNLDKHRKPRDTVDDDPNSPTGYPLLDQLLNDFRNSTPSSNPPPSTLNTQLSPPPSTLNTQPAQKKVPGAIPVFLREPTPGTSLAQRTLASPERCILATFPPKR